MPEIMTTTVTADGMMVSGGGVGGGLVGFINELPRDNGTSSVDWLGMATRMTYEDNNNINNNNNLTNLTWPNMTTTTTTTATEPFVIPDDMRYTITNTVSIVLYR